MLITDPDALRQLAFAQGRECPECGNAVPSLIADNGCSGADRSYCCAPCGNQWDAEVHEAEAEQLQQVASEFDESDDARSTRHYPSVEGEG